MDIAKVQQVEMRRVAEGLAQTMGMSAESLVTDKTRWVVRKPGGTVLDENAISGRTSGVVFC